jgi:hypothetical protein
MNHIADNVFFKLPSGQDVCVIHVPKSGGTSVRCGLFDQKPTWWHPTWAQVARLAPERAASAIVLAIVRGPRERILSMIRSDESFRWCGVTPSAIFAGIARRAEFNGFVDRYSLLTCEYLAGRKPDLVIRQEYMQEDVDRVCAVLGLPKCEVPKINVSVGKLEWSDLEADLQAKINEFIAPDVAGWPALCAIAKLKHHRRPSNEVIVWPAPSPTPSPTPSPASAAKNGSYLQHMDDCSVGRYAGDDQHEDNEKYADRPQGAHGAAMQPGILIMQ